MRMPRPKTGPPPGGRRPAVQPPGRRPGGNSLARALAVPVLAVLVAIGIGVYFGLRSGRETPVDVGGVATAPVETAPVETAPPSRESAKELFAHTCGSCHTLAAAGVTGGIGPNLDEAKPTRDQVLTMIRNGSLSGAMPAGLLTGDDAERVAAYVSRNVGR